MLTDSTNPRVMADNIKKLDAVTQINAEAIATGREYSTSEYETGEIYTDGEKVYGNVIEIESLPNNTSATYTIANLGEIISMYGIVDRSGDTQGATIPYGTRIYLRYSASGIVVETSADYSGRSGRIFVKYTKTPATP